MESLVRQAIKERRLIEFWLHGLHRVAEPHLYGRHKGVLLSTLEGPGIDAELEGKYRLVTCGVPRASRGQPPA